MQLDDSELARIFEMMDEARKRHGLLLDHAPAELLLLQIMDRLDRIEAALGVSHDG